VRNLRHHGGAVTIVYILFQWPEAIIIEAKCLKNAKVKITNWRINDS
jgi:hypothetical protein